MADYFDRLLARVAGSHAGPGAGSRDGIGTDAEPDGGGVPALVVARPRIPALFESGHGPSTQLLEEDDERMATGALRGPVADGAWPVARGGPPAVPARPVPVAGTGPAPGRPLPPGNPDPIGGPADHTGTRSVPSASLRSTGERSPGAAGHVPGGARPDAPVGIVVPGNAALASGTPAGPRGRRPTARPPAAPTVAPGVIAVPGLRARRQPPPAEQVVQVRIGRIEVTTRQPPPAAQPVRTTRRPPELSLERYLEGDRPGAGEVYP